MASSIVHRVAASAAIAASAAALLSSVATIVFASVLMQRAEDQRLEEALTTFAVELKQTGPELAAVREVQREESEEMEHTGMLFALYDSGGASVAGDHRVELPPVDGCSTVRTLRVCRAAPVNGFVPLVGASHTGVLPLLAGAAVLAALLAAALAFAVSRPISRRVVAPLTRLRERISQLDPDNFSRAALGDEEQVAEVDALRATISQLIVRVEQALSLAQRFAANAAHELRTPLTTVRAELELLAEGIADADARAGAQRAQEKLTELSVLVERLLILSSPARSTLDANEVVSLRDLLEDAAAALPPDERARIALMESDANVRGDAVLLGSLVANALSNALKFATAVRVSLTTVDSHVVLHIDDDGPGVAHDDRERVFEPFFRSVGAWRERVPGHGLGLPMIRHIAQMHGGTAAFVHKTTSGARLEVRLLRDA